ncbi:pentatricopeptide repeat-containing protein At4g01570-like [Impatiens glandulifera]|uniref:pentatricopeptide repeat-containing protein At4g01570-like n=1 Tax=Impatiens glandulifera TaxID=253017 RepID=UPI001FB09761|nr:pentatricopeptide repeat-containing protein At4g01570-like [Impatiens glandulifera]
MHHVIRGGGGSTTTRTIYSCFAFILCRNISNVRTSSNGASHIRNSSLVAFVVKALCRDGGGGGVCNLEGENVPISEGLVLQILRRNSLDIDMKVDFFRWCTLSPNYKHSSTTYLAVIHSIFRSRSVRRRHDIFDILISMKRDGHVLDSSTFNLVFNAFVHSSALKTMNHVPELYGFVIVALIRKGQIDSALSIFFKLLDASELIEVTVCNELLTALKRADMKKELIQVFNKLRTKRHFKLDWLGYNICIHAFGCCWGDLEMSMRLFEKMKDEGYSLDPDLFTFNSLIHALCLANRMRYAIMVWEESCHETDAYTYRILIQACFRFRIQYALKIFTGMLNKGLHPDSMIYNSLLNGLFNNGMVTNAVELYERMIDEGLKVSLCTYNILIVGLFNNGKGEDAYTMFCDLKDKCSLVNGETYKCVILQFCKEDKIEEALNLVEEMEARGFIVDLVTIESLLIKLVRKGRWDLIERLLKHIREENLFSPEVLKWKTNIDILRGKNMNLTRITRDDDKSEVVDIEEENSSQLSTHKSDLYQMISLKRKSKRIQSRHVTEHVSECYYINMVNVYLSAYLAKGDMSLACQLFVKSREMGLNPITYTYNSIISCLVDNGYFDEAWDVLHKMDKNLCNADVATYNMIIHGLGKMGRVDLLNQFLNSYKDGGGYLDHIMYNTLINAFGKCGDLDKANKFFEEMKSSGMHPCRITFNTMIDIHAKAGRVEDAHRFLKMMLNSDCAPNHVTDTILKFLEVLNK